MKKIVLVFLINLITLISYAQISFEKGYFINDFGQKVNCLIKNIDWKNNPNEFSYKLSENSEVLNASIGSIEEFGIVSKSKYTRSLVKIDRSSSKINNLNTDRNPVLNEEQLFLKVLVEGEASLFLYKEGSLERYFYKTDKIVNPELLIYKLYKTSENKVAKNSYFQQQLWNELKCNDILLNDLKNINYKENDLVNLFVKYNLCQGADFYNFKKNQKKDLFNLIARPGINFSSLTLENSKRSLGNINFDKELALRFGIEGEFILPYYNNKLAILFEPTFQSYESKKEAFYLETQSTNVKVDYSSIELPLGFRYYSFINDKSKLFFNISYIFDFPLSNSLYAERRDLIDLQIRSKNNVALGLGYQHNNSYVIEIRYASSRNVLNGYFDYSSQYKSLSIIFGYKIF